MKALLTLFAFILLPQTPAPAQNTAPTPAQPTGGQPPAQTRPAANSTALELADYGVLVEPEPRLIVVMAALEAAGFNPTSAGKQPSAFRQTVRSNAAGLDQNLLARLRNFYEEHKLPAPATPAQQAARYVSLALALGPAPAFDLPARTDDLPAGVLEVLDFTPLVREFYRAAGGDKTFAAYAALYNAEATQLRQPAAQLVRETAAYLRTRPVTSVIERVPASGNNGGNAGRTGNSSRNAQPQRAATRERARRFHLVPDLLAAPTAINFRIIADDYYAIVPPGANLASSELRRAYLQFLVDPLVARFNREIALRRPDIRALLDALPKTSSGAEASLPATDVFTAVARSLVVASDVRMTENARARVVALEADRQLQGAGSDAPRRARIVKETQAAQARIADESILQLAEAYERGAVLAFYFADQLRGVETSGFDVANSLADMITSFDAAREKNRLGEAAAARARSSAELAARRGREAGEASGSANVEDARRAQLIKNLDEIDELLRARNYTEAERRLRPLMTEFQGEPRVFFALAQAASLSAQDATDADVQAERLGRALANYRLTVNAASPETDKALLSRAHAAAGRILAFLERGDEAAKEFDAAIKLGDIPGGAYADAVAGKRGLSGQR